MLTYLYITSPLTFGLFLGNTNNDFITSFYCTYTCISVLLKVNCQGNFSTTKSITDTKDIFNYNFNKREDYDKSLWNIKCMLVHI